MDIELLRKYEENLKAELKQLQWFLGEVGSQLKEEEIEHLRENEQNLKAQIKDIKEIILLEKYEKEWDAFYVQEMSSREKIAELTPKAISYCQKKGLLTQEENEMLQTNHPEVKHIEGKALWEYLFYRFLKEKGELPPEEEE